MYLVIVCLVVVVGLCLLVCCALTVLYTLSLCARGVRVGADAEGAGGAGARGGKGEGNVWSACVMQGLHM
jgi:hypothetical protein